jgi:hypothetical protein
LSGSAIKLRRCAGDAVKQRREMALVGAACGVGNVRDRQVGPGEKLLGQLDAALDHVPMRRNTNHALEQMRKVIRTHRDYRRELGERQPIAWTSHTLPGSFRVEPSRIVEIKEFIDTLHSQQIFLAPGSWCRLSRALNTRGLGSTIECSS